jgi:muramoyltetrapeptide carboxypeptidase
LQAVGFRTENGFDGLHARGTLWGGNLTMVCSMLGTRHFPQVQGGILFVEDVSEHPYRIERCLLQLHQAGVLARQRAVLIGAVSGWKASPLDRGYTLKSAVAHLRSVTRMPVITGLPFGHVPTKVTLPLGVRVELAVQGREVLVGWSAGHN